MSLSSLGGRVRWQERDSGTGRQGLPHCIFSSSENPKFSTAWQPLDGVPRSSLEPRGQPRPRGLRGGPEGRDRPPMTLFSSLPTHSAPSSLQHLCHLPHQATSPLETSLTSQVTREQRAEPGAGSPWHCSKALVPSTHGEWRGAGSWLAGPRAGDTAGQGARPRLSPLCPQDLGASLSHVRHAVPRPGRATSPTDPALLG